MEWLNFTFYVFIFFTSLFNIHLANVHDEFCVMQLSFFTYTVLKITSNTMCVSFLIKYPEVKPLYNTEKSYSVPISRRNHADVLPHLK